MGLPEGLDLKKLKLIGQGIHGRVYLIDSTTCIKIYKRPKYLSQELKNLLKVQNEPWFSKIVKLGKDFMIREYVRGIQLNKYLESHPLNEFITRQLIDILKAFKNHQFKCMDIWLKNIIITPKKHVKVLDLVHVTHINRSYPKYMLAQLQKLDQKDNFLSYVQKINPELYKDLKSNDLLYLQRR
jgi:serine/threonine protein kinase